MDRKVDPVRVNPNGPMRDESYGMRLLILDLMVSTRRYSEHRLDESPEKRAARHEESRKRAVRRQAERDRSSGIVRGDRAKREAAFAALTRIGASRGDWVTSQLWATPRRVHSMSATSVHMYQRFGGVRIAVSLPADVEVVRG